MSHSSSPGRWAVWICAVVLCFPGTLRAGDLPRATPESQGVSTLALSKFVVALDEIKFRSPTDSLHSVMLLRHGHVIAEAWWTPYDADTTHQLYSLSKSFTSTAVGLAIADGKLSVDDEVLKFFPDAAPSEPSANLKSMRVSDLLRMSTGHQIEPARPLDASWTKTFLAQPVPFKPGTHFLYNTSATYMQSAIVQKVTGQTTRDYLLSKLFEPLNIKEPKWEISPEGVTTGGYGLNLRTEDIAKFGQLYLQRGKWHGKQLVPSDWVDAATARQTSNGSSPKSDWDQGYGYQFWRCRHGAYRGDGAFGQYCVVLPEQDAVLVMTSGIPDMQSVLNVVWDKLLPAFEKDPLPKASDVDQFAWTKLQKSLVLKTPTPGDAKGEFGKTYKFDDNDRKLESVRFEHGDDGKSTTLVARIAGVERKIACPIGEWKHDRLAWGALAEQPIAACGAWTDEKTFVAQLCFVETPFTATLTFTRTPEGLKLEAKQNVGFGKTADTPIVGKAE
ncbi:MAG: serine hydrolase [Pirellulales bacterium]